MLISAAVILSACSGGHLMRQRDPELYRRPAPNTVTFWGHATAYIDIAGFGIVTDPVFVHAYVPHRRRQIPAPPDSIFKRAQIALVSHAHHDHLSRPTLESYPEETVILCPEAAAGQLDGVPQRVIGMRPGDLYEFPGGTIFAVAAHHPGGKWSLKARHDGRAIGFVIQTHAQTIYYSGDTEYFPGMEAIGRTYAPDLALINISVHLHRHDAMRAVKALGSPRVIPMHHDAYGGILLKDTQRWRNELAAIYDSLWTPLAVGESYALE